MNEQLIADLKETRRQLEVRGRCTGDLVSIEGKVCLDGAIGVACIPTYDYVTQCYEVLETNPRANAVAHALYDQLKGRVVTGMGGETAIPLTVEDDQDLVEWIFTFNDANSTTDQDCFDLIDKALAEQGGL